MPASRMSHDDLGHITPAVLLAARRGRSSQSGIDAEIPTGAPRPSCHQACFRPHQPPSSLMIFTPGSGSSVSKPSKERKDFPEQTFGSERTRRRERDPVSRSIPRLSAPHGPSGELLRGRQLGSRNPRWQGVWAIAHRLYVTECWSHLDPDAVPLCTRLAGFATIGSQTTPARPKPPRHARAFCVQYRVPCGNLRQRNVSIANACSTGSSSKIIAPMQIPGLHQKAESRLAFAIASEGRLEQLGGKDQRGPTMGVDASG